MRPPIWYARLDQANKNMIKKIIGESALSSKELEYAIQDNIGAKRDDIKKLLTWWFSSDVTIYIFLKIFLYKIFSSTPKQFISQIILIVSIVQKIYTKK